MCGFITQTAFIQATEKSTDLPQQQIKAIKCYMYTSIIQQQKGIEMKNQLVSIQFSILPLILYIYGTVPMLQPTHPNFSSHKILITCTQD